jgi:hypothetical protein
MWYILPNCSPPKGYTLRFFGCHGTFVLLRLSNRMRTSDLARDLLAAPLVVGIRKAFRTLQRNHLVPSQDGRDLEHVVNLTKEIVCH